MGVLLDRVSESLEKYGNGVAENFKNNSLYFYYKYQKSNENVQSVPIYDIQMGRFYFFHYYDDSNWKKYSPVFTVSMKKVQDLTIINAINLNLIPIEVRSSFFDQFITEKDLVNDRALPVEYTTVYNELRRYGFEYSIMEYNAAQLNFVHRINMKKVPTFLYSAHPINKYDPKKLYDIWKVKIKTKEQRHKEITISTIKDLMGLSDDLSEHISTLKNHVSRNLNSLNKYGRKL